MRGFRLSSFYGKDSGKRTVSQQVDCFVQAGKPVSHTITSPMANYGQNVAVGNLVDPFAHVRIALLALPANVSTCFDHVKRHSLRLNNSSFV